MNLCRFLTLALLALLLPFQAFATPEYAEQTGWDCLRCHVDPTGGTLTKSGEVFKEDLQARGLYRPLRPLQRGMRLALGYLHLLTAIAWFGTILYVHLLLKPAYAAKGLPKGELVLGWLGMILLTATGIPLTIARIPTWEAFYTTRFGLLLSLKIVLFALMVLSAGLVTFWIGPKLRRRTADRRVEKKSTYTLEELSHFDGAEKRPAYIAYRGKIYDVSLSKLWVEGNHVRKHQAGNDLTEALKSAPHGEEKVLAMPLVGEVLPGKAKPERSAPEKAFYFMAYMNLLFVFLITFIVALWRWG
ncbi:MAG: CopD family protein [Desulfobacterota bacterium]|nr:CopD family protein [Thermodesulfobacteriota bacterium]